METPTWQKTEMKCSCGNKFKPHYRNGILVSKKCPNCQLKSLHKEFKPSGVQFASEMVIKRNKPEKRKKTKSSLDKRLDTAWSKLVKLKSGNKCAVCSSEKTLNSHHIYSRAKMSLRWSTENGICLCVNCHIGVKFSAHKTPVDFNDWLYSHLGPEFMDGLKLMAHTQSNLHEFEKEYLLKELQSEIKNKIQ